MSAAPAKDGALARVQAASGLAFFVFAGAHVVNTMLAAVSAELYDAFQTRARALYQHPVIEIALLASLAIHVTAGVLRVRAGHAPPRTAMERVHRYSGRILALVIVGHVAFTRGPSLLAGVHPQFLGVAYAIVKLPAVSYPYFAFLSAIGITHAAYGVWKAWPALLRRPSAGGRAPRALAAAVLVGIGVAWLGVLGLGGRLYAIGDPGRSAFAALVERMIARESKTDAPVSAK